MFRMSVEAFEFVLQHINDLLSPQEINGFALTYLATGESFQSLNFQFRINGVSYIIKDCCDALVERLIRLFVKIPASSNEWLQIYKKFEEQWNYPHALGTIDGKHFNIKKPKICGSFYYNYKHTHSIIFMAIACPDYECLYADVGSNGRVNDGEVWNKSGLLQAIENVSLELPGVIDCQEVKTKHHMYFLGMMQSLENLI